MSPNDTKLAPEKVLKQIQCNCKGELCTFFQHATAYSKQLGLDWFAQQTTWDSQFDLI